MFLLGFAYWRIVFTLHLGGEIALNLSRIIVLNIGRKVCRFLFFMWFLLISLLDLLLFLNSHLEVEGRGRFVIGLLDLSSEHGLAEVVVKNGVCNFIGLVFELVGLGVGEWGAWFGAKLRVVHR